VWWRGAENQRRKIVGASSAINRELLKEFAADAARALALMYEIAITKIWTP
jgi:hypothetical protein